MSREINRAYGLEEELSFSLNENFNFEASLENKWNFSDPLMILDPNGVPLKNIRSNHSTRNYIENGGMMYIDIGSHPEYATPEVNDARLLPAVQTVGTLLVEQTIKLLYQDVSELTGNPVILKRSTDHAGNSWGCHINVSITKAEEKHFGSPDSGIVSWLELNNATSAIYSGAGGLVEGRNGLVRVVSPKLSATKMVLNDARGQKPLVCRQTEASTIEALSGQTIFEARNQQAHTETNMYAWPTALKSAMIPVIFAVATNLGSPEFSLSNPKRSAVNCAHDTEQRIVHSLSDGQRLRSIDIQEYILESAEFLIENGYPFPDDQIWAIQELRAFIDRERSAQDHPPFTVEWRDREKGFEELKERGASQVMFTKLDLAYTSLKRLRRLVEIDSYWATVGMVSSEWIQYHRTPPEGTRATSRAAFIRQYADQGGDIEEWKSFTANGLPQFQLGVFEEIEEFEDLRYAS